MHWTGLYQYIIRTLEFKNSDIEKMFINFFTKERLAGLVIQAGFKINYQEEVLTKDSDSLSNKVIYTIATKSS